MPKDTPKPILVGQHCKGCGRCIEACAQGCIEAGTAIDPGTGLMPVVLHLEKCTACGLCFDACPEPYGLLPEGLPQVAAPPPGAGPTYRTRHHNAPASPGRL